MDDVTGETLSQMEKDTGRSPPDGAGCCGAPRRGYVTLLTLCALSASAGLFVSLLAPFFSTQALSKGATDIEVGLMFGIFQIIVALVSPVFGKYMTVMGPKFMVIAGNFVASGCAVLFGLLQWCPPGRTFIIMAFVVRSVEAVGAAANFVAIYAIAAHSFPERIATVMGVLESSGCVGLMIGPPIGGALYGAGGFFLPFAVSGGIFMAFTLFCIYILPSVEDIDEDDEEPVPAVPRYALISRPLVAAMGTLILAASALVGFLDISLSDHVTQIHPGISQVYIGLIFLLPAAVAATVSPLAGILADKYQGVTMPLLTISALVMCISMLTIGPCPYLSFLPSGSLVLTVVSVGVSAVGTALVVVSYQQLVKEAKDAGLPDSLSTQGLISGYNSFCTSIGSGFGPTVGGILIQEIGFAYSTSVLAGLACLALILLIFGIVLRKCGVPRNNQPLNDERQHLLGSGQPT